MPSHAILNHAENPFGDSTEMKLMIAEEFIRQCGVWSHFEKYLEEMTLPPELTPSVRIVFCRIGVPEQEVDDAQKAIYTGTDHSEPA